MDLFNYLVRKARRTMIYHVPRRKVFFSKAEYLVRGIIRFYFGWRKSYWHTEAVLQNNGRELLAFGELLNDDARVHTLSKQ